MNNGEHALVLIRSKWPGGSESEREQILSDLKRLGMAITDVIVALRAAGVFSLGEAKQYVSNSVAWRDEVNRSKPVQDEGRRSLNAAYRSVRASEVG
jgi:hypothetical protein